MPPVKPLRKVVLSPSIGESRAALLRCEPANAATSALNIVHKRATAGSPSALALASGLHASPAHNLRFRGGRTLQTLTYVNLYVGGSAVWSTTDVQSIDRALNAAMSDTRLNTVINQYFQDKPVSTIVPPSQMLAGPAPKKVSRASMDSLVRKYVVAAGRLNQFDPKNTVFNFLLPSGVVLTTDGGPKASTEEMVSTAPSVTTQTTIRSGDAVTTITVTTTSADASKPDGDGEDDDGKGGGVLGGDPDDADSSLAGLGGYHGSVHAAGAVIYFAVGVYSQTRSNGTENGIVAFDEPWKNVVATFYHELQEARTDPDVEDAIRTNNDNFIGWNSSQGEEIGDFPVFEANPLQKVFKEIPLVKGGTAPIQLMYSNRVNGPEDPTT